MCECQKAASDNFAEDVRAAGMEKDVAFEHVPSEVFLKAGRALGMGVLKRLEQCPQVGVELVCVGRRGEIHVVEECREPETPDNLGSHDAKSYFFLNLDSVNCLASTFAHLF